jgi:hypothetical protein
MFEVSAPKEVTVQPTKLWHPVDKPSPHMWRICLNMSCELSHLYTVHSPRSCWTLRRRRRVGTRPDYSQIPVATLLCMRHHFCQAGVRNFRATVYAQCRTRHGKFHALWNKWRKEMIQAYLFSVKVAAVMVWGVFGTGKRL